MCKAVRAQNAAAAAKAKTHADLVEAHRHREYYADQEACFAVLASESFDETMEDCKEEGPTRRALKKASLNNGQVSSNDTSVYQYSSPAEQSHTSNKRNQVSSPSAHYAPKPTGDDLAVYLEPGGLADLEVRSSIVRAQNVMRTSGRSNTHVMARMQVGQGTPRSQGHLDRSTEDNQDGIVLSREVATGPVGAVLHIIHIMILLVMILAKNTPKTPRWAMTRIALATKRLVPPLCFLTSPFLADAVTIAPWLMQHKNQRPRKHTTYATVNLSKLTAPTFRNRSRSKAGLMRGRMAIQYLLPRQAGLAYVPQALLL
jgi:hypothetical protein